MFWSRKSSAVADEALDLAAAGVDLLEALHGEQVIDARIYTDLRY